MSQVQSEQELLARLAELGPDEMPDLPAMQELPEASVDRERDPAVAAQDVGGRTVSSVDLATVLEELSSLRKSVEDLHRQIALLPDLIAESLSLD